ncbi:MAG: ATP-dependent zinc metalloprotease FtsH [Candidatus Latescibacterota bacterium]
MDQEKRGRQASPRKEQPRNKEGAPSRKTAQQPPQRSQKPETPERPERPPDKSPDKSPEKRPFLGRKKGDQPFQWKQASRTMLFWVLFILVAVSVTRFLGSTPSDEQEITYSQYRLLLKDRRIQSAVIVDRIFHGYLTEPYPVPEGEGFRSVQKIKLDLGPIDADTKKEWEEYDVTFYFKERGGNWLGFLIQMLPWIFFIGLWFFIFRQMQGGQKGVFSFGKSKAKLLTEDKPKVTFKDVAGAEEAKQELQEIIEFLKDPAKFQKLGGRIPKGVLLVGPPGTGKTYMAKAVSGEAGVPFFSMSGSDFVEMFVGVGASRVRDLFLQGKKNAPCIIFVDEIDAVGRHRGAGIGGGHDEREQTLNQLLVEMDGFESNEGVIFMAATNRPDVLDPALMRPGRFDRVVVVDRPDVKGREGILRIHTRDVPLAKGIRLSVLARGTPGLSGADLQNLVNEAALLASRKSRTSVTMSDFEEARDKVMMGTERKSMVISDEEKKLISYHEVGHTLVAKLIPGSDPIHKVTIIPRGRALGLTHYLPIDEKHTYSKTYCVAKLAHALGGRAAELIAFGELTTGSGNDYEQATALARNMVCEWGMSEKLGPMTYGKKEEEIFLGREIAQHRDFSEKTAQTIDAEVRALIDGAEGTALGLLRENEDKMHMLAHALLEFEVLDGDQIDKLLRGEKIHAATEGRPVRRRTRRPPRRPTGDSENKARESHPSTTRTQENQVQGQS